MWSKDSKTVLNPPPSPLPKTSYVKINTLGISRYSERKFFELIQCLQNLETFSLQIKKKNARSAKCGNNFQRIYFSAPWKINWLLILFARLTSVLNRQRQRDNNIAGSESKSICKWNNNNSRIKNCNSQSRRLKQI